MDKKSLETLLESTGLPYAYHHFKQPPALPYLIYLETSPDNFSADNRVYHSAKHWRIELYTAKKDPSAEQLVETALSEVYWEKSETYIESEGLFQVLYEI